MGLSSLCGCSGQDAQDVVADCIFCQIVEDQVPGKIVWQDSQFFAFEDRSPAAKRHLLVCPKRHVKSIKALNKDDISFLVEMRDAGLKVLTQYGVPDDERRLGFHIPPFNTVSHLHMHVLALPFNSAISQKKYPIVDGHGAKHKGLTWFVEVDQAILILESGHKVGVFPC